MKNYNNSFLYEYQYDSIKHSPSLTVTSQISQAWNLIVKYKKSNIKIPRYFAKTRALFFGLVQMPLIKIKHTQHFHAMTKVIITRSTGRQRIITLSLSSYMQGNSSNFSLSRDTTRPIKQQKKRTFPFFRSLNNYFLSSAQLIFCISNKRPDIQRSIRLIRNIHVANQKRDLIATA